VLWNQQARNIEENDRMKLLVQLRLHCPASTTTRRQKAPSSCSSGGPQL
jgi:hypothetical protein